MYQPMTVGANTVDFQFKTDLFLFYCGWVCSGICTCQFPMCKTGRMLIVRKLPRTPAPDMKLCLKNLTELKLS